MSFDPGLASGMGVLSAVVDSGSFAKAADRLDITPSGVSRAISRLEKRLGIRLFDRTTRSVQLTDEGRCFYQEVAPLLAGLEDAANSAADSALTVRGRLRVNIDPYFSRLVLGPILGEFMRRHPQLQLDLHTKDQLGDLVADGFDLAIRFGHPQSSSLVARKLMEVRVLTVAAPAYFQRYGRPARPQDLEHGQHVCIDFRDTQTGRPFAWEFHRDGHILIVPTNGRLIINDASTLYSVCEHGHAVAQMLDLGLAPALKDGRLVDVFPDWPDERFPLYAFYPSRHLPAAKVRAFLEFVQGLC